jgi:predicted type IV restriction endonuclease
VLLSGKDAIQVLIQKYQGLTPKEKTNYNEANTVNSFIRPLFEALGWDFSNIDEVEVKSLRHELTDEDRQQAISYAYNKGVTWAILTNFDWTQVFNAEIKTQDLKSVLFLNLQS